VAKNYAYIHIINSEKECNLCSLNLLLTHMLNVGMRSGELVDENMER
jgi:hypothetical protein